MNPSITGPYAFQKRKGEILAVVFVIVTGLIIVTTDRTLSGLLLFLSLSGQAVLLAAIGSPSRNEGRGRLSTFDESCLPAQETGAEQTRLAELEERLAECERLCSLGQLAAGVAHELNNPLGGILVYSHLLKEDTEASDPRMSNINKIIRESNRLKRIIKSLLDFARQSPPFLADTDVNAVIQDALDNIRRDNCFRNITVVQNLADDLPAVRADSSQIQEVFENIIRNAAEMISDNGDILIESRLYSADDKKPMVEIVIADSGPGIPDEHMDHIFDPFYTTKLKGHGTGLGLAVCSGIIERHNGTIAAGNRDGGGAEFTVRLGAGDST